MYYLRHTDKTSGVEHAVYKHHDFSRFYRGAFTGLDGKWRGMKLYQCRTLKKILEVREATFNYCGVWYDIFDENGIVHGEWERGTL